MTTALIYDPIFLEHITPQNHPEKPQRLEMAVKVLEALNWLERDGLVQIPPRAATQDEHANRSFGRSGRARHLPQRRERILRPACQSPGSAT